MGLPTALSLALAALVPGALAIPVEVWQHGASLVLEQRFVDTVVVPRTSLLLRRPRSVRKVVLFGPLCSTGLSFTFSRSSCAFAGVATRLPCHCASCSRAGVPGRRGFALESGGGSRLS